MNKLIKYLTATAAIILLSTAPVNAESATQKIEPVCKSIVECDKLSHFVEAQIDELKAKGTLTKDEKRLRFKLNKQLLAVQRAKTAEEKAKTQAAYVKVSKKLDDIRGRIITSERTLC